MTSPLHIVENGAILEVTLQRPPANAIDVATSREMGEVFCRFRDEPKLRVAILTGDGHKFFCAGWDLTAAAEGEAYDADYGAGGFGGITELHDLNKPIIAAVNGLAVGGGFELVLAADLVIAARHAQFFLPEILSGLLADAACMRLPRKLPRVIAMEMLLTGRKMEATEAARWGLVNAVCDADVLMEKCRQLAASITEAAPLAIAAVKEVTRATEHLELKAGYALMRSSTLPAFDAMLHSADAQEGPRAFAEKRKPRWQGK